MQQHSVKPSFFPWRSVSQRETLVVREATLGEATRSLLPRWGTLRVGKSLTNFRLWKEIIRQGKHLLFQSRYSNGKRTIQSPMTLVNCQVNTIPNQMNLTCTLGMIFHQYICNVKLINVCDIILFDKMFTFKPRFIWLLYSLFSKSFPNASNWSYYRQCNNQTFEIEYIRQSD